MIEQSMYHFLIDLLIVKEQSVGGDDEKLAAFARLTTERSSGLAWPAARAQSIPMSVIRTYRQRAVGVPVHNPLSHPSAVHHRMRPVINYQQFTSHCVSD